MKPTNIILHHSLTKDSQTVSWNSIRYYHMEILGWRDIGYQYGIELIGNTYEILTGRMLNESGAHTRGMNNKSVGICFVNNFDLIVPPTRQWKLGIKLVKSLMEILDIPKEKVFGHREFSSYKSCPGNLFDMDVFRQAL